MNLQHLKYLVTIADCHSITKAAKTLFVSQPYLSKVVPFHLPFRKTNEILYDSQKTLGHI